MNKTKNLSEWYSISNLNANIELNIEWVYHELIYFSKRALFFARSYFLTKRSK